MKNLFFTELQAAVADRLNRKLELRGIPVLLRQASDFESRLEETVTTGLGICVVVLQPLPSKVAVATPGLSFSEIEAPVLIVENVLLNDTGQSALGLAEIVSRQLHQWTPLLPEIETALALDATSPWDVSQDLDEGNRNEFELTFITSATLPALTDLG